MKGVTMPGKHNIEKILADIDEVTQVAAHDDDGGVESTHPEDVAEQIAHATGHDVVVISASEHDDPEAAAVRAALAAKAAFLPGVVKRDLETPDE